MIMELQLWWILMFERISAYWDIHWGNKKYLHSKWWLWSILHGCDCVGMYFKITNVYSFIWKLHELKLFFHFLLHQYITGTITFDDARNEKTLTKLEGLMGDVIRDFQSCKKILMPIFANSHWHLMEVNFEQKKFYDYNSLILRKNDLEIARWVSVSKQLYFNCLYVYQHMH